MFYNKINNKYITNTMEFYRFNEIVKWIDADGDDISMDVEFVYRPTSDCTCELTAITNRFTAYVVDFKSVDDWDELRLTFINNTYAFQTHDRDIKYIAIINTETKKLVATLTLVEQWSSKYPIDHLQSMIERYFDE